LTFESHSACILVVWPPTDFPMASCSLFLEQQDSMTIEYFKQLSESTGISYQNLINLYLRDCATQEKKPSIKWNKTGS